MILGVVALLAALEAGVATAAVVVESDSACPSADAVRDELHALGGRNAPRSASVMVRNRGDRLTVEFAWPGAAQSEIRELAVEPDCGLRAQAAGVVAASWLGILPGASLQSHPLAAPPAEIRYAEIVPLPPLTAAPVAPLPPAARTPTPAPLPEPSHPVEPPPPAPAVKAQLSVEAPRASEPWRSWLGIGLEGSAGGGLVPGLRLELVRLRAGDGLELGWMASSLVTLPRSRSVGGGTAKWIRPAIGVAGLASLRKGRVQLGLDIGPLLGLTVAWGSDYPTNETDTSVTWGLTAGLRVQMVANSSKFWVELRVIDWLRTESLQHEISPSGHSGSAALPSVEGLLSLGWSLAL